MLNYYTNSYVELRLANRRAGAGFDSVGGQSFFC